MLSSYRIIVILMLVAFVIVLTCNGCYPKRIGPKGADGKRLTWAEMNKTQRKEHMRAVVLPRAHDIFKTWRPQRFKIVQCTLCHGRGMTAGDFRMPTNHLPRLSGELLLGAEFDKHPDTTRLKLERLVPEMADALGVKPFSLITRSGFGCYSCHLGPNGPMYGN